LKMAKATLKGKREELELTAAMLARVFDVSSATVFRQEATNNSWLWWYALRGIESELKETRRRLLRPNTVPSSLEPEFYFNQGLRATAERMAILRARHWAKGIDRERYDELEQRIVKEILPRSLAEAERLVEARTRGSISPPEEEAPSPNVVRFGPYKKGSSRVRVGASNKNRQERPVDSCVLRLHQFFESTRESGMRSAGRKASSEADHGHLKKAAVAGCISVSRLSPRR
jgi:hypothetical protein